MARAVEHSVRARHSPDVQVIDPKCLAGEGSRQLVRELGPEIWDKLVGARQYGVVWRACGFVAVTRVSPASERRACTGRSVARCAAASTCARAGRRGPIRCRAMWLFGGSRRTGVSRAILERVRTRSNSRRPASRAIGRGAVSPGWRVAVSSGAPSRISSSRTWLSGSAARHEPFTN